MLTFEDVTTRRDGRTVLEDVSVSIPPTEFVLVVGANGAGKTTFLQHLNGLREPSEGTVHLDGTPLEEDLLAARQAIGMVFQEPRDQLIGATVGTDVAFGPENLGLPRDEITDRVAESLHAVGMAEATDRGIDTLSHGERTRVAIAGALAMQPRYLVLDEPFVGLDARGRSTILEHVMDRDAAGTGVIVATHDVRDVYGWADRILGLIEGQLVVDTDPEDARDRLSELDVRPPAAS